MTEPAAPVVSVIIPAYNEAERIVDTLQALQAALDGVESEILVVDDGSRDRTGALAEACGARVLKMGRNRGKGAALVRGFSESRGDLLLMLDADLAASAAEAPKLLTPIREGRADMTVATFPKVEGHRGGFGLVMRLARWGLKRAGAPPMRAPLSGQRAMTRAAWEKIARLDPGFGIEMGLNLDAARARLRLVEVETAMSHRLTGRSLAGFRHRARQFRDVAGAIFRRRPRAKP